MEKVCSNFNGIKVEVNPFVECLGAVFILSDFSLNKVRNNQKYIDEIKETFKSHNSHPFVLKMKELLKIGHFRYDAPLEILLCFINNTKPSKEILSRPNLTMQEYLLLKKDFFDFYSTTNFETFYNNHKTLYLNNINDFIERLSPFTPHEFLFDFMKLKSNNLNVVLMHSLTTANYGLMSKNQIYCFVRPYYLSRFDNFDFAYDLPYVTTLILHEFAHSFINPLTDKFLTNKNLINKNKLNKALEENGYGTHYETAINESIIRAIECIYVKNFFNENYEEFKKEYINDGFVHIPILEEFFNKQQNKPINEYYQELLKIFY